MGLLQVIDALVAIEQAVPPPAGEKDIAEAYDEIPRAVLTFPCFVNIEQPQESHGSSGLRDRRRTIDAHLLFCESTQKYSIRSRRAWEDAVLDHLCRNLTLNGTVSAIHGITTNYEPVSLGETEYIACTFSIEVQIVEAFAFAAVTP
jgi:hypothetical protein